MMLLQCEVHPQCIASSGNPREHTDLHPILADIQTAASFPSADDTIARQAAEVVQILCGLLHPDAKKRLRVADIRKIPFPQLHATFNNEMPVCPLSL